MLLIYYLDYRYYFLVIHKLRITYYNDVSSVKFCKSKAKKFVWKFWIFAKIGIRNSIIGLPLFTVIRLLPRDFTYHHFSFTTILTVIKRDNPK